jgi:hypothetical protein
MRRDLLSLDQTIRQDPLSPGQAIRQDPLSPGQAIRQDPLSPGQTIRQDQLSPGQAIRQDQLSPGQAIRQDPKSPGHAIRPSILLATALGVLALSGCGSGATKTVSVSSAIPSVSTTQSKRTTKTRPAPTTTTTTSATTTTHGGGSGAETTRTSTAPAFTKESTSVEGLGAAQAVVKAHGFTAGETSDYRPEQTLRVLVGTRTGSSDGYGQQAFFFVDGRYIGTDTSQPSATIKVVGQSDTEVTLAYPLYKPGDPLSHPSGGERTVHFQLNNGRLVALNPIPPVPSRTGGE